MLSKIVRLPAPVGDEAGKLVTKDQIKRVILHSCLSECLLDVLLSLIEIPKRG